MFKEERDQSQFDWSMLGDRKEGRPNRGPMTHIRANELRQVCPRCLFGWLGTRHNRVSGAPLSELVGLVESLVLLFLTGASLCAATYEQRVIAAVIAGEASNQGRAGMVAVAEVICQRVNESGWTPFRVVTHGNRRGIHAFSCLNRTTPTALVRKWSKTILSLVVS